MTLEDEKWVYSFNLCAYGAGDGVDVLNRFLQGYCGLIEIEFTEKEFDSFLRSLHMMCLVAITHIKRYKKTQMEIIS